MEKIIYNNQDVSKLFQCKENALIDLYAKKHHTSVGRARKMYNVSKLKNVISNLNNELWLESESYILDHYENLMERCPSAATEKVRDEDIMVRLKKLSSAQQHKRPAFKRSTAAARKLQVRRKKDSVKKAIG